MVSKMAQMRDRNDVKEEWRLCADWLVRSKILASDHKVTWETSEVFDLAQTLRDGVLICYLLNALKPGTLDLKDFSQRPQMSQFLCLKNIRMFLVTCKNQFGMQEIDLFKPDDLFDMKDFGKVISTLSKLSKISESSSRIPGFPPSNVAIRHDTDYYNTLEELFTGFSDRQVIRRQDDKIYEGLANRAVFEDPYDDDPYDRVPFDTRIYTTVIYKDQSRKQKGEDASHLLVVVPRIRDPEEIYGEIVYRHRDFPFGGGLSSDYKCSGEQDLDETEDLYDQVYIEDHDEIYDDLCSVRKRKSHMVDDQSQQSALNGVGDKGGLIELKTQRDYCIKELVETERNYVDALFMIIKHFIRPLKSVLPPQDHTDIFKHIEELNKVHTGFLSDLQQACVSKTPTGIKLPECFTKWKNEFLIYGDFCSNLPRAQERIDEICRRNQTNNQYIEKCQMDANEGKFRLRDLLSVPMQRVLKYHLLLKELIRKTDDTHPERRGLEQALEAMQDLSLYVNEVKRDHEGLQLIQEIQNSIIDLEMRDNTSLKDYGKLLKDGELRVKSHDDNKVKTRYIFLFDKVMLMCKSRGATFSFKNALIVSQHRVEEGTNLHRTKSDKGYYFLLVERREQHAYTFYAKTEDLKRKWIDAIAMALDNTQPQGAKQGNHDFTMHSFDKPTTCDVCGKLLRGVFYQGYKCQSSNMKVHKECIMKAPPVGNGAPELPPRPATGDATGLLTQRPIIGKCKAQYSFHGNLPSDGRPIIKFEVGDVIEILSETDQYWWEGRLNNREGYFPANFVTRTRQVQRKASYEQTKPLNTAVPANGPLSPRLVFPPSSPPPTSPGGQAAAAAAAILDLAAFPWYVGEMGRDVAVQRLEKHASGTYLIRSRINEKGEYALSIKFGTSVKHIKVNRTQDNMFYLADCKLFRSMPDLVEYYQKNTLMHSFPELQTVLVTPYKDATRQQAMASSRGGPQQLNILGYCIANFDYAANQPNQLSLRRSDRIAIISKAGEDRGWWKGQLHGRIGYFPMAYVVEEGDENLINWS